MATDVVGIDEPNGFMATNIVVVGKKMSQYAL